MTKENATLVPWGHYLNRFGDFCVVVCDKPDENGHFSVWHSTYASGSRCRPHHPDGRVIMQTSMLDVNLSTFGGDIWDADKPDLWAKSKRTRNLIGAALSEKKSDADSVGTSVKDAEQVLMGVAPEELQKIISRLAEKTPDVVYAPKNLFD